MRLFFFATCSLVTGLAQGGGDTGLSGDDTGSPPATHVRARLVADATPLALSRRPMALHDKPVLDLLPDLLGRAQPGAPRFLDHRIDIDPPEGDAAAVPMIVRSVTSPVPGAWAMTASGVHDQTASLILVAFEDEVAGYLSEGGHEWSLQGNRQALMATLMGADEAGCGEGQPSLAACELVEAEPTASEMVNEGLAMAMMVSSGPYAGVADTIDLLFVYDSGSLLPGSPYASTAALNAAIVAAVVTTQGALASAGADVGVRVVGMEDIDWSYDPDLETSQDELEDANDGVADIAHTWREVYGADVVVGITPPDEDNTAGGNSPTVDDPSPANTQHRAFMTVSVDQLNTSIRHELGHQLGVDHDYSNVDSCNSTPNHTYACGYAVLNNFPAGTPPTPLEACTCPPACPGCTGQTPGCVWTRPFTDVMSRRNLNLRQNFFSNPNAMWLVDADGADNIMGTCDDEQPTPQGSNVPYLPPGAPYAVTADGARRVRETAPIVATYRDALPSGDGAVLLSPAQGADITTSTVLVTWNLGAASEIILEVGTPDANPFFVSSPTSTTSLTLTNMPTTEPVLAVRLWSNMGGAGTTGWWIWRDYRWETDGHLVSCNADPSGVPDPSFALDACTYITGTPPNLVFHEPCKLAGDTLTCDLDQIGNGTPPEGTIVTPPSSISRMYHLYMYGVVDAGRRFCCMLDDSSGVVHDVVLRGTTAQDLLSFTEGSHNLTAYNHAFPDGQINALGGPDDIFGSNTTDADYSETLLGQRGADIIHAGAGNDVVEGGRESDQLFGEAGHDTLIAGSPGLDLLRGGEGWDILCAPELGHALIGSDVVGADEATWLYYSSNATGVMNPATAANTTLAYCGHLTTHGSAWGGCDLFNLSQAPGACLTRVPN
jgi:hypothetical protein